MCTTFSLFFFFGGGGGGIPQKGENEVLGPDPMRTPWIPPRWFLYGCQKIGLILFIRISVSLYLGLTVHDR